MTDSEILGTEFNEWDMTHPTVYSFAKRFSHIFASWHYKKRFYVGHYL